MKAIWNGEIIAESDETIVIEGNHYFPPETIKSGYFNASSNQTTCPWKGLASYYNIEVNGNVNSDAAWYYPEVSELAKEINGYVAFWKGIEVTN